MEFLKYVISKDGKKRFLNKAKVEEVASVMAALATRAEVAKLLGVNQDSVLFWTQKHLLKTVKNQFTKAYKIAFYAKSQIANFKVVDERVGRQKRRLVRI
jgi:MerR HTH family regulatory protein